jgi:hypothetical protein
MSRAALRTASVGVVAVADSLPTVLSGHVGQQPAVRGPLRRVNPFGGARCTHDLGSRARPAEAVGFPALCRDEIKEGRSASNSGFVAALGDPLTMRT